MLNTIRCWLYKAGIVLFVDASPQEGDSKWTIAIKRIVYAVCSVVRAMLG